MYCCTISVKLCSFHYRIFLNAIITVRKRTHLSVILFTGGRFTLPPGQTPPSRHPLGTHPPWAHTHTPGQTPLGKQPPTRAVTPHWADTPLGRHPLGRPHPDGQSSGRYASYWNAFLLQIFNRVSIKLEEITSVHFSITQQW